MDEDITLRSIVDTTATVSLFHAMLCYSAMSKIRDIHRKIFPAICLSTYCLSVTATVTGSPGSIRQI